MTPDFRVQLRIGTEVKSADGERLGQVFRLGPDTFAIEAGFFFQTDYEVGYDDVADVREDVVYLKQNRDELRPSGEELITGRAPVARYSEPKAG